MKVSIITHKVPINSNMIYINDACNVVKNILENAEYPHTSTTIASHASHKIKMLKEIKMFSVLRYEDCPKYTENDNWSISNSSLEFANIQFDCDFNGKIISYIVYIYYEPIC
jgi:hypothetical protein